MMVNKLILILLLILTSSCKKRDCDDLHQKTENAFKEYKQASEFNNANPSVEDSLIAVEKYEIYEDAHNDFLNRGCYYSKYVNK